ncbi:DUF4430 domain-containing protein [Moorena sp. SIO4G3]|uniref:DUF4430 domain-containing protein n=1 Tax=Moorena sp. SIO4G3 TaxID=2607821 RepID=UPI00142AB00C|nr:DUF4430 domain-containing protein [Moorena sp. SIO4G3]NEO82184.1 DUF4430 domain-containing protein [Moorena sp. SIO4G3]
MKVFFSLLAIFLSTCFWFSVPVLALDEQVTASFVSADIKLANLPRCYWMENYTGNYNWVDAPQGNISKQECHKLDSCDGGLGESGGGCYKWAITANGPRIPWTCSGAKGTVNFKVDFPIGSDLDTYAPWIENSTVSLAMRNLSELGELQFKTKFSCPFGDLVTSIDSVPPGQDQFWALFINNNFSEFGIDTAILKNGDSVLWKICSSSFGCP